MSETVTVGGDAFTKRDCYLKALELNPNNKLLWNSLGVIIGAGEKVDVAGQSYTMQDCFRKALECSQ